MAISVVGYTQAVADANDVTCDKPTGTLTGDMMIAFAMADWAQHDDLLAPAGWSLLDEADNGASNTHHKVWYKSAISEGADYTFNGASSAATCVSIVSLRGVDPVASNWVHDSVLQNDTSASRTAPSLTGDGDFLLCAVGTRVENETDIAYTAPAGMAEIADISDSNPYSSLSVAYLGGTPPNPTTARTFVLSGADALNGAGTSILFPAADIPDPVNPGIYVHNGTGWVSTTGGVAVV